MICEDVKLVAIDLDGTLLNDKRQIPEETVQVIRKVIEQGITVTLASGRSFCSVLPYAQQLDLKSLLITHCGAYVTDMGEEQVLIKKKLDVGVSQEIMKFFEKQGYYIKAYCDEMFFVQEETPQTIEFSQNFAIPYTVVGKGQLHTLTEAPFRIVLQGEPARIQAAQQQLDQWQDEVIVFHENTRALEILDAKVSKGVALRALCKHLQISTSQAVAIGNEGNDREMLCAAGLGIAMGNACATLKEHADIVIPNSNVERGVEYALRKYVLKESF